MFQEQFLIFSQIKKCYDKTNNFEQVCSYIRETLKVSAIDLFECKENLENKLDNDDSYLMDVIANKLYITTHYINHVVNEILQDRTNLMEYLYINLFLPFGLEKFINESSENLTNQELEKLTNFSLEYKKYFLNRVKS